MRSTGILVALINKIRFINFPYSHGWGILEIYVGLGWKIGLKLEKSKKNTFFADISLKLGYRTYKIHFNPKAGPILD